MDEKEFYGRIKELEKRFSELMDDLRSVIRDFETYKKVTENELAEAQENVPERLKRSRKQHELFYNKNPNRYVNPTFVKAYEYFMGENNKGRLQGYCDNLDFLAYLYLVAYKKGWFEESKKDRNKQTFAKYMRDRTFAHLGLHYCNKSFSNHLKPIMSSCGALLEMHLGEHDELPKECCTDQFTHNFRRIYNFITNPV